MNRSDHRTFTNNAVCQEAPQEPWFLWGSLGRKNRNKTKQKFKNFILWCKIRRGAALHKSIRDKVLL